MLLVQQHPKTWQEIFSFSGTLRSAVTSRVVTRLVPRGKGAGLAEMMLTPDEVRDVYRSLFLLRGDALEVVSGDPLADSLEPDSDGYEDRGDTAYGGCAAGISGLTLMPDGTITPCRRLPIPIGNVMKDSLREVWAESRGAQPIEEQERLCGQVR